MATQKTVSLDNALILSDGSVIVGVEMRETRTKLHNGNFELRRLSGFDRLVDVRRGPALVMWFVVYSTPHPNCDDASNQPTLYLAYLFTIRYKKLGSKKTTDSQFQWCHLLKIDVN